MTKIKRTVAAGKFYPSSQEELSKLLDTFRLRHKEDYNYQSRLVIVPHAGYSFSGQLAFDGLFYLNKNAKNIFVIAPTHHKSINNLALADYDEFETPLGNIKLNNFIQNELINEFSCEYSLDAFENEHAIEVLLPIIKTLFPDVKIVPILVGNDDVDKVFSVLRHYFVNPNNAFLISSDLSHFLQEEQARQIDILTARMIEDKNMQGFRFEQACGAVPIFAAVQLAIHKNFDFIRVGLTNSSSCTGDTSRVVGYGSWFLYEGGRNDFIKENFSPKILSIVKKTINEKMLGKSEVNITAYMPYPQVLESFGASFVTLELEGKLRGCIGSVIAQNQLIVDLIRNAHNAAFADPRFVPLTREEFDKIEIAVSLLSNPTVIEFNSEEDLLNQIRPNIDGIIIRDKDKQALYLPSVWEQLPDKKAFLNSLKQKAGFNADYFSKTFEAYRFVVSYIK